MKLPPLTRPLVGRLSVQTRTGMVLIYGVPMMTPDLDDLTPDENSLLLALKATPTADISSGERWIIAA